MIDREEVERVAKMCHDASYDERLSSGMLYRKAASMLRSLLAERESFYMEYRMKCDAETKKLLVRAEKAEIALDAEQRHSQLMRERVTKAEAERDKAFAEIARLVDQCRAVDQLRVEANALWAEELDKAIKYGKAMADNYRDYNECAPDDTEGSLQRLHDSVDDFHKWMEGRK